MGVMQVISSKTLTSTSEDKFRHLAESAPFAIVVTRLEDGVFLFVNDRYCKIVGAAHAEIIGKPAPDFYLNPEERQSVVSRLKQFGEIIDSDIQLKRMDGAPLWVSFSAQVGSFGDEKAVFASIHDITDRKKAEDELCSYAENLSRTNAELEQFAYIASHDLQEPLRMINGYLKLLEQRYADKLDKDANEFISFAVDGAYRMQQMINDLLVFSRVETRGKELVDTESELALNNARENLVLNMAEANAQVTFDPLPLVRADPTQLTMLFQNLLGNAIKFRREEEPRVHISARRDGNFHEFCVQDNGIGLDVQYAERVFAIFQKLHSREQYGGTGIGLAICKRIVARHGGRIWVQSNPGQGARFYFTLPAPIEGATK